MNIIIEGLDKSGKTTIVNDIRESLFPKDPVIFKISRKPAADSTIERKILTSSYEELFFQAESPINKSHIFLFDRAYPSEMVYSVKRGYDAMEDEDLTSLDFRLGRDGNTLLIYCEADPETIERRFKEEREEYAKPEDIKRLISRYEVFLAHTHLPFIRVNSLTDRGSNLAAVRSFLKI